MSAEENRRRERGRDGDPLEEDVAEPDAAAPEIALRRRGARTSSTSCRVAYVASPGSS